MHMKKNAPIKPKDVDQLLSFIPKLYALKGQYVKEWSETGHPEYHPVVLEFFRYLGSSCWVNYGYNPVDEGEKINDDEFISNANLESIRSMFTWCQRGERFCDDHWESILRNGKVFMLLLRLKEIRNSTV